MVILEQHESVVFEPQTPTPFFVEKILSKKLMDIHTLAANNNNSSNGTTKAKVSYTHGCSNVSLLYETIGERLRLAAEKSEKLALGLIHLGLEKGDRVGIWSPNNYEWIVTQFATALAGYILVNVNPMYQSEDLSYAIDKVGLKCLIAPPEFKRSKYYQMLQELIPELEDYAKGHGKINTDSFPKLRNLIIFDSEGRFFNGAWKYSDVMKFGTDEDKRKLAQIEKNVQPDCAANIQYTSGTTGKPKGATLTHYNIVNNAYFVGLRGGYHERKTIICIPNPLYHCFGCVMGSLSALIHFQTCVFPAPSFEPLAALKAIHEERCTALYGTPTMYIDILNHEDYKQYNLSSIHSGIVAGAPCPVTLCSRLVNELGMQDLQVCYGTTETSPVSFMSIRDDPPEQRIRNVGHIMDHIEAAIVDKEGRIVQRKQRGDLLIRGYCVMHGYWDSEDQTRAEISKDRWYHTGDIGVMNDNGTVSIVGRSKDMIVRGGENVYPIEIEQFIDRHPDVADVQIIGVPDDRFGEVVCAWIRLKYGAQTTEDEIRQYCKGKIAHYKIPKYIFFKDVNDFPMTVTGKVKKFEMREISKQDLGLANVESHFHQIHNE